MSSDANMPNEPIVKGPSKTSSALERLAEREDLTYTRYGLESL